MRLQLTEYNRKYVTVGNKCTNGKQPTPVARYMGYMYQYYHINTHVLVFAAYPRQHGPSQLQPWMYKRYLHDLKDGVAGPVSFTDSS